MINEPWSPSWMNDFNDLKREIETGFHGLEYTIEHIGSTSVPNLAAKPIIDIDMIYFNQNEFEPIKLGLNNIGYYHAGNQGIQDRDVFKRKGKCTAGTLDTVKHHLYVCPIEINALERHILTRNFLRKHDWARLEY